MIRTLIVFHLVFRELVSISCGQYHGESLHLINFVKTKIALLRCGKLVFDLNDLQWNYKKNLQSLEIKYLSFFIKVNGMLCVWQGSYMADFEELIQTKTSEV